MIKGFIEVHNAEYDDNLALVNVSHIVDVWDNTVYTDDVRQNEDYPHIKCVETYEEIKQKIKEAVGDSDA